MNLFGIKIDPKKLLTGAAKIVGPAIVVAVVTHTSVKTAVVNAAKDAARQELDKAGA
jgi:hypothetical protein